MNRIREWRQRKSISLDALASRLGISKSQLSRIETGQRGVTLEMFYKIAEALEVSPADLLIPGGMIGMPEDVIHYTPPEQSAIQIRTSDHERTYKVISRALDELDILPGDIIRTDEAPEVRERLKTGDIVLIETKEEHSGERPTLLLRIFNAPRLFVTNSTSENTVPINTKVMNVTIRGLVNNIIRLRHSQQN